jgi:hypothetical protein
MTTISVQEIEELSKPREGLCVSIYIPTIKASDQVLQNPIRFKNMLNEAGTLLAEQGMGPAQQEKLLEPALTLWRDDVFWQQQEHGLAVFVSSEGMQTMKLPAPVDEMVKIGERFHVKPLYQFLYEGGDFYILALSQNEIRLLKGTPNSVEEVDTKELPANLQDALNFDDFQKQLQWHTGTVEPRGHSGGPASGGERPAMFHGHGGGEDDKKNHLLQYFQKIDKGLNEMLKDKRSPLVLSGVEYLHPIYKEANTYNNLINEGIPGNPELTRGEDLHKEAWKLVEPVFKTTQEEIVERFNILHGRNEKLATQDLKQVIEAAPFGRVEVLFVDKNASQYGKFDTEKVKLTLTDQPGPEDEDLVDFAALQTLANGGIVYMVEPGEVPGGKEVAAILRF